MIMMFIYIYYNTFKSYIYNILYALYVPNKQKIIIYVQHQMANRGGVGGNRLNQRRGQGSFQNRAGAGAKSAQKPGAGGGIRKQNAFDRAKKLLAKNANNKKKDTASAEKKTER